ncbi:MAG: hypothetical protein ACI8RZ_002316 [Myxococcota bacterium]
MGGMVRGPPVADVADDITLLGVRHHSPACGRALRDALRETAPDVVLIEGPPELSDLSILQDPGLTTPVALFSFVSLPGSDQRLSGQKRAAGWYPFCDYSPELVAIQTAGKMGIPAAFCDLSLHGRLVHDAGLAAALSSADRDLFEHTVPAEDFHAALRAKTGARDDDDLWDRLFELHERPWSVFFHDTATYGAMLRKTGPVSAVDALREATMATAIREAQSQGAQRVVLVCGAYHLDGIREALEAGLAPPDLPPLPHGAHHGIHLVPYDFRRMARLRYAAGMPQPAWYQADWSGEGWLAMLTRAAGHARSRGLTVSTAALADAAELTRRLAAFRGHPHPARIDALDAMQSCWSEGGRDGGRLMALVEEAFCGDRAGVVGPRAGDPPLVADVDRQLAALSLAGGPREVRLRPVRAARDRERSRLLSRLDYLGVEYGRLLRGPDPVTGKNLDRVEQVWAIGWTPESRSALMVKTAYGATLIDATAERLRERLEETPGQAGPAVARLIEACALGLTALTGPLLAGLADRIDADSRLSSVLDALHGLVLLLRYRDALDAIGLPVLNPLIARSFRRALALLTHLPATAEDAEPDTIDGLRSLDLAAATVVDAIDTEALITTLTGLRADLAAVPGVQGGVDGLLWRRGALPVADLTATIIARFAEEIADAPGRYLSGLAGTARRAYTDGGPMLGAAGSGLSGMTEPAFRAALPRLRRAHAALTPAETARLSQHIAARWGGRGNLSAPLPATPEQLQVLTDLDASVRQTLAAWGLPLSGVAEVLTEVTPTEPSTEHDPELLVRWRLVLGRYAEGLSLPGGVSEEIDEALGFLYDREYDAGEREQRGAGSGETPPTIPEWINAIERLFPKQTYEALEAEALDRYGLLGLVTDPEVLARCQPSLPLLEAILRLKDRMEPHVLDAARRMVAAVVKQLTDALSVEARRALSGRAQHGRARRTGSARSFDGPTTIRRNLRHFHPGRGVLVVQQPWFRPQVRRHTDWRIIIAVDQSGSMLSSTIHAGITAAIFAALPGVTTHLIAFDTRVVNLTGICADPVETLLSTQLGGGTNIGQAVGYCSELITRPSRTLFVLISDLYEGARPGALLAGIQRMVEGGVTVLALAALNEQGDPDYDRELGRKLVSLGARVGAMTPGELVRFVGEVLR